MLSSKVWLLVCPFPQIQVTKDSKLFENIVEERWVGMEGVAVEEEGKHE